MKLRYFKDELGALALFLLAFVVMCLLAPGFFASHNPILNGSIDGVYVIRNGLDSDDAYYYKPLEKWVANERDIQPAWLVVDEDHFSNVLTGTIDGDGWGWKDSNGNTVIPQFPPLRTFRYLPFTFGFGENPKIPSMRTTSQLGITYNAHKKDVWRLDEGEQVFPCIVSPDHKVYAINSVRIVEPELDMDVISVQQAEYDGCDWDVFINFPDEEPVHEATFPSGGFWALVIHDSYSTFHVVTTEGAPTFPPLLGKTAKSSITCDAYGAQWGYFLERADGLSSTWSDVTVVGIDNTRYFLYNEIGPLEVVQPVRNANTTSVVAATATASE